MRIAAVLTVALLVTACKKQAPPVSEAPPVVTAPAGPPSAQLEAPAHIAEMRANFEKVFFELDQHTLSEDAKQALAANAKIMQVHGDVKLEIQGHADERGTTDYNIALAQRRADTVAKQLMFLGVNSDRVATISFGEERPAVVGQNETAWAKNRRAEFRITWSGASGVSGTVQ